MRESLRGKISQDVQNRVQGSVLQESYAEIGRGREAFQADASKYDEKQRAIVQKAIDSGSLNNTNRAHDFVDTIAKIAVDKGVDFDFSNNSKLKESGFALEGKEVNGFVKDGTVTLNMDSKNAWQSTVGHEIAHVLEGTELSDALQKELFSYAEAKGELQKRMDAARELYKGVYADDEEFEAKLQKEVAADLVGDFLFTDEDFVKNLSTGDRNLFQKIYDEVKYLCKVVTAGSKEARQMEKIRKTFQEAYRVNSNQQNKSTSDKTGARYSLLQYDQHQKENWENSGKIVVYENEEQLRSFVGDAENKVGLNRKLYFGAVPTDLALRIKNDTGVDVDGFNITLRASEVRKIFSDHGNNSRENARGQRAITVQDFVDIPEIISSPDEIRLSQKTYYDGKPVIEFVKEHNGRTTIVSYVSTKHHDLTVQTLYSGINKESLSTATDVKTSVNTPGARAGTALTNMVSPPAENVKGKLSLSSDNSKNQNGFGEYATPARDLAIDEDLQYRDDGANFSREYQEADDHRQRIENDLRAAMDAGDQEAFDELYNDYADALEKLAEADDGMADSYTDEDAPAEREDDTGEEQEIYRTLEDLGPVREDIPGKAASAGFEGPVREDISGETVKKTSFEGPVRDDVQAKEMNTKTGQVKEPKRKNSAFENLAKFWKAVEIHGLDDGMPFEKLDRKLKQKTLQTGWQEIRNANKKAQYFLGKGKKDANIRGIYEIQKEVKKAGKEADFQDYMLHWRNVDGTTLQESFGMPNKAVFDGINSAQSRNIAMQYEQNNPEFKQWAQEIWDTMAYLREKSVKAGLLSREGADLMAKMYPHYIPIRRKIDGNEIYINFETSEDKDVSVSTPFKRATGGTQDILPMFNSIAKYAPK